MELDVGRVISRAFEMFKNRLGPLVGLWLVFFVIQIAAMLIFGLVSGFGTLAAGAAMDNPGAFGAGMIIWFILFYVMYILIYCAQSASMSAMASPLLELNFGDAFSRGLRSAPAFFGAMILLLIAYFVVALGAGLVIGLLGAISSVLSTIGIIALIPVILYLACRLAIISPVIAVEQQTNPITAITRTWSLTRGNVLGVFLTMLVFIVGVAVMVGLIFLLGFGGIMAGAEAGGAGAGIGATIFLMIIVLAFSILLTILGAALFSSLHEALAGSAEEDLSDTFG